MPKENIEEAILFLKIQKKIIQNYKEREKNAFFLFL